MFSCSKYIFWSLGTFGHPMETGQSGSASEPDLVSVDLESIRKQINDNLNRLRMRTKEDTNTGSRTSSVEAGNSRSVATERDAPKTAETETLSSVDGVPGGGQTESVRLHDPLFLPRSEHRLDSGHSPLPLIGIDGAWSDARLTADQMQQQIQQHLHLCYLHSDAAAAHRWRTPPEQQRPLAKTDDAPTDRGRFTSFFVADILAPDAKKPSSPSPTSLPHHPSPSRFRPGGSLSKTEGSAVDDGGLSLRTEAFAAEWNRSRFEVSSDVIESNPTMIRHRSHVINGRGKRRLSIPYTCTRSYY